MNVLNTVLALYADDDTLSLPTQEEVLLCTSRTTAEEVTCCPHIFWSLCFLLVYPCNFYFYTQTHMLTGICTLYVHTLYVCYFSTSCFIRSLCSVFDHSSCWYNYIWLNTILLKKCLIKFVLNLLTVSEEPKISKQSGFDNFLCLLR